ncbi:Endocytosis and vacuole integrity protein [Knufia peltigerae]|uniref:Endocytosis and vacuole integrity protein n=1 Tax=Knufia peltigerae TaxID=1002370 RepID=A0AA38Y1G3_9EURO|nr:Endocytosis and vacuole integrity protein [Knufia peltigerae]
MTHAFLQSELTNLISDSKRKSNDVRTAAEQSLADLKAISFTSETQLAGDLLRRAQFIDPFVLACKTKNSKLATTGTVCLQRLTASRAVPRSRLPDVLDAFHDGVSSGYDPQLKILQTLPSLLQLYGDDLREDLLARTLEICAALQSSKTVIVSHTATATFEQLVSTVFEQAWQKKGTSIHDDQNEDVSPSRLELSDACFKDAVNLFHDLCLLLDQEKSQFLKVESLPSTFLLETLHTVFSAHRTFLTLDSDQLDDCWGHLVNGLSRVIGRKEAFGHVVQAFSLILLILQEFAEIMQSHITHLFPSILNALEKEGNPTWKRTLCLEFFRSICSDFTLFRNIFDLFDNDDKQEKFVGPFMSALVRIAAEDPSLIGLGRQSTIPVQRTNDAESEEAASIEAQGLGGAITSVSTGDSSTIGISMNWSVLSVPLMDQPEKQSPPALPSTYIYALVLGCIASLCDGLSKFVMPLSVPSRSTHRDSAEDTPRNGLAVDAAEDGGLRRQSRPATVSSKYQRLVNPLSLSQHPQLPAIRTCASIIETCWPAGLATCSTFLNSALDSEFYHILIRSVQKLAQVSGVLELSTPRDALLTTLAKSSIPTNATSIISNSQNTRPSTRSGPPDQDTTNNDIRSPIEPPPTPTSQAQAQPLNVRHLLCLRALLNLGIALGPTLEQDAWYILIETMQTVEALIAIPSTMSATTQFGSPRIGTSSSDGQATLAGEIASVQAATKRMLESTKSYNQESFSILVQAFFRLFGQDGVDGDAPLIEEAPMSSPVSSPTRLTPGRRPHRLSRSVSGLWTKSRSLDREIGFVLNKISDISRVNLQRFSTTSEQSCSWDLIGKRLLRVTRDAEFSDGHRLQAASILDLIAMETMKLLDSPNLDAEDANAIRLRCLQTLLEQLDSLGSEESSGDVQYEMHRRLLEALESMLSHNGDSFGDGWPIAFDVLSTTFYKSGQRRPKINEALLEEEEGGEQNAQILRVSFRSMQLIASDFLNVLSASSMSTLSHLLRKYGSQFYDLNVALTSTTLLWSLASHIMANIDTIELEAMTTMDVILEDGSKSAALWSVTLLQLVELSKDPRTDVRNAAIRVLLKMLDASAESLSPGAWSVALMHGPLKAIQACIEQYTSDVPARSEWLASASQLTDGTIQLICDNMTVIMRHASFGDTWLRVMGTIEAILRLQSLQAASLAFSNLSRLLSTLRSLQQADERLVVPALRLWAMHSPVRIQSDEQPNQSALAAHMHVFVEAHKVSNVAVTKFEFDQHDTTALIMDAIEKAVLQCTHPPYTNDVKALEPEQKEASEGLGIVKELLRDDVGRYSRYLLRLVRLSLNIQDGRVGLQHKRSAIHKAVQRPTFVAFASACVEAYKMLILEEAKDENLIHTLSMGDSFQILFALIKTKYTELATNNQAPLWRSATVTAVVLLEALQKHVKQGSRQRSLPRAKSLADAISSTASSILGPGGLGGSYPSKHKDEVLFEDEKFDIEHFRLFHKALVSVFKHDDIPRDACRAYAIALFQASLLAKPWFHDLPDDLVGEPLTDLLVVRPGSLHKPVFVVRRQACYTAMAALFELAQRPGHDDDDDGGDGDEDESDGDGGDDSDKLARAACPYLLLRVVHPLKTFLADQRLRGLTPPPPPQQAELEIVLANFVELRSHDAVVREVVSGGPETQPDGTNPGVGGDGKEHLRLLYSFMLRVHKFWRTLPRLKGPGAWQTGDPGQGIERALEQWERSIGTGWGLQ